MRRFMVPFVYKLLNWEGKWLKVKGISEKIKYEKIKDPNDREKFVERNDSYEGSAAEDAHGIYHIYLINTFSTTSNFQLHLCLNC